MKDLFLQYLRKKCCCHSWKQLYKANIWSEIEYKNGEGIPIPESVRVTLVCEKCGEIKQIEL